MIPGVWSATLPLLDYERVARDTDKLGIAARGQPRQFFSESEVLDRKGVRAELKHMRISKYYLKHNHRD